MPNALNYATAYQAALAQAYPNVLHFAALRSAENDARYRWTGAKTIEIPSLSTTGRVDADRDTINVAQRNYENAWEPKTLANHRKWSTLVHPMDIDETNHIASIQNITTVFNQEQKFPEMDAYMISKIFTEWGGTADTTVLTADNILSLFDDWMAVMDDKNVPSVGRILYAIPAVAKLLKQAQEISRFVQNGDSAINRAVRSLDEVKIETVPSALMKTVYDFTEGWAAGAGAKQINMALIHPSAVITPEKYAFAQLDPPSAGSEGKYVYFEESYDDVFVLNKRKDAIMFHTDGGCKRRGRSAGLRVHRLRFGGLCGCIRRGSVSKGTVAGAVPLRVHVSGDLSGGGVMLMLRTICPVDYSLCSQAVTVYHWDGESAYTRTVIRGAFLDHRKTQNVDKTGSKEANSFLLVVPGPVVPVAVGDKVLAGEGEEISTRDEWAALIPSKVPGLVVVKWVDPKYWRGSVVHTEAGG